MVRQCIRLAYQFHSWYTSGEMVCRFRGLCLWAWADVSGLVCFSSVERRPVAHYGLVYLVRTENRAARSWNAESYAIDRLCRISISIRESTLYKTAKNLWRGSVSTAELWIRLKCKQKRLALASILRNVLQKYSLPFQRKSAFCFQTWSTSHCVCVCNFAIFTHTADFFQQPGRACL